LASDEDGRNLLAATRSILVGDRVLTFPGHQDVEDQALGSWTQSDARNASAEEKARAAKANSRSKSGSDSRTDSSVVDDGHEGTFDDHCTLISVLS